MTKSIVALILAAVCTTACSQPQPSQSAPAGQAAAPAPAGGQAQPGEAKPAAEATGAAPAGTPSAAPAPASTTSAAPSAQASPAPAAAPSTPPPPPAPTFREVTIPAGTSLSVTVLSTLASDKSKVEDPVKGSIAKAVTVSGVTALPAGTQILGSVTEADESGRVKGKAAVAFRFDRLVVDGETVRVQTASVRT